MWPLMAQLAFNSESIGEQHMRQAVNDVKSHVHSATANRQPLRPLPVLARLWRSNRVTDIGADPLRFPACHVVHVNVPRHTRPRDMPEYGVNGIARFQDFAQMHDGLGLLQFFRSRSVST